VPLLPLREHHDLEILLLSEHLSRTIGVAIESDALEKFERGNRPGAAVNQQNDRG
jgi:hypothetical protein